MINKTKLTILAGFIFSSPVLAKWEVTQATSKISDVTDGLFTIGLACLGIPLAISAWHFMISKNQDTAVSYLRGGIIGAVCLAVGKGLLSALV